MKVYISQLVETEKIKGILEKYDVGLEIVLFASPYCLDRQDEFIENYKEELGDLYGKISVFAVFGANSNFYKAVRSYYR